jgi:hypothetical protein
MPEPVPAPTTEQLVIIAEIAMVSVDEASGMVASDTDQDVSSAKWARTLTDIDRWDSIRNEGGDIKRIGNIEFFEGTSDETRLEFRNLIRGRYGLDLLTTEVEASFNSFAASSLQWF